MTTTPSDSENNTISIAPTAFHQEATDWFYDRYQSQTVWLHRALLGIVFLFILLALSLATNVLCFPLKEKVPYLYGFNDTTGEIKALGQLVPSTLNSNWQLTRFFLIRYVINRESYDSDDIDVPYQIAWAMSAPDVAKQYDGQVDSSVATSPFQVYGKDKFITVRVLDVSPLNPTTVTIRFIKTLHDRNSDTTSMAELEAIVRYHYTTPITTQAMLDRDPLGFQVTYYQTTQITLDDNLNTSDEE